MILALDISTSITGVSVVDKLGKIVYCSSIDLRKENDFFSKADLAERSLIKIKEKFSIEDIFIEQPFQFFNSGGSSAKTMSALQRFNGTVSWICYKLFATTPQYLTAGEARAAVGIKVPRGEKAKPAVLQFVLDNDPHFPVEYTSKGNPKPDSFDKADSWVIGKAGWIVCNRKSKSSKEH